MYSLPDGYKGKLVVSFDCSKEYGSDVFFMQKGCHTVDSPLGTYLETAETPLSRFGFRFNLENIDKPHMLVLRYPEDKRRHMLINDCFSYDLSTGIFTDVEYPVSGKIGEIHNLFWARSNDMTLTVTSWGKGEPAAVFGFDIYELEGLPENKKPECEDFATRRFGVQYEDPNGALGDLGAITPEEWCDKFIEFAKHTGQNVLVQPIHWYFGPYFDSETQPSGLLFWLSLADHNQYSIASTKAYDWITPFLDKFEEAGIDFIGGMTLMRLGNLIKNMNIDSEAIVNGADTYNNIRFDGGIMTGTNDWTRIYNPVNHERMVAEGKERWDTDVFPLAWGEVKGKGTGPMFNPLHPEVQKQIFEYFEEISRRFGHKKAFKGISVNIWHSTLLWFSSLKLGYDDYTVSLFEKETGICVPSEPRDPERFRKRYEYLMRRNREAWIKWRCQKIRELILGARDALRKHSPDLTLYICTWKEPLKRTMFGRFNSSMQYPVFISEKEFLREGGIDVSLFAHDEGISFSTEQNHHRDRGYSTEGVELKCEESHFFHDLNYMDRSLRGDLALLDGCGAFIFDSWTEGWGDHVKKEFNKHNPYIDEALSKFKFGDVIFYEETLRLEPDGYWYDSQRQITACYPTGRNYLEPFAHALAELDALYMLRGGLYLDKAHVAQISEYIRTYTKLPAEKFNTVKGTGDPVVVREKTVCGKHYVYAVNREPYDLTLRLGFERSAEFKTLDGGDAVGNELRIPAFGLVAIVCKGENKVTSCDVIISAKHLSSIQALYSEQMLCFAAAEKCDQRIAGLTEVKAELISAYNEKRYAKLRHITKSYVAAKAREITK